MPPQAGISGSVVQFVQTHLPGLASTDQALVIGWLKAVQRRNCQPRTLQSYCGALKAFVQSWDGHRPGTLLQVQRSHIEQFIDSLEARGLQPGTINTLLSCVHRFYRHLIHGEQLQESDATPQLKGEVGCGARAVGPCPCHEHPAVCPVGESAGARGVFRGDAEDLRGNGLKRGEPRGLRRFSRHRRQKAMLALGETALSSDRGFRRSSALRAGW